MNKEEDNTVTKSCGNVFSDLGFPPADATVMLMRVEVLALIIQRVRENEWTEDDVVEDLGISQPDAARLFSQKLDSVTLDELFVMANKMGLHVRLDWLEAKDSNT